MLSIKKFDKKTMAIPILIAKIFAANFFSCIRIRTNCELINLSASKSVLGCFLSNLLCS